MLTFKLAERAGREWEAGDLRPDKVQGERHMTKGGKKTELQRAEVSKWQGSRRE